jgi:hypothetical protein
VHQVGNKHTHIHTNAQYVTHCFSTATMGIRKRLDVIRTLLLSLSSKDVFCFLGRVFRYNGIKKNQLDAQLILSIFRQPLHVSGVSRPIIRRYNRMYTTIGTYCSF